MNTAGWPIFGINLVSAADFVRFWDGLYDDDGYDEPFYRDNIGLPPAAKAYEWFKWKNGTPLSGRMLMRWQEMAQMSVKRAGFVRKWAKHAIIIGEMKYLPGPVYSKARPERPS